MVENAAGALVRKSWEALPAEFPYLEIDAFVIMPNHVHGVLWIRGGPGAGAIDPSVSVSPSRPAGTATGSLARVVQAFKSRTTNGYIQGVRTAGWPAFDRRIWQRNYFEHVVRNEDSLALIRHYIMTNPQRWGDDIENDTGSGRDDHEDWVETLVGMGAGRRQASPLQEGGR